MEYLIYQQLFPVIVQKDIFQSLLNVHSFLQVLQETVEVDHILMDALKGLVESGHNFHVVLTEFLITILKILQENQPLIKITIINISGTLKMSFLAQTLPISNSSSINLTRNTYKVS